MESWRRSGDFRQRERRAKRASERRVQVQRTRAGAQTRDAISQFEEVLKVEREKQERDIDDLPPEAEAGSYDRHTRSFGTLGYGAASRESSTSDNEPTFDRDRLQRAHSDTAVHRGPLEHDPCMMRPPSPLSYYDYGSLSVKPRSVFAQHKQKFGESTRSKHRQTTPGFYFPGGQFKQGPYGFSMLDPCLMASRSWQTSKPPPVRWENDPGDVRPHSSEHLGNKRNRVAAPVCSDTVRTTRAHALRAQHCSQNQDKNREEKFLEQVKFENGLFDGRWRDPTLDHKGVPEEPPVEQHDWIGQEHKDMHEMQQLASRILFGLQNCLRARRAKLSSLFKPENSGHPGVLEPQEFLRGLERLGILQEGELPLHDIMEAMTTIDPNFDGRVNLPLLNRAIAATTKVQNQRTQATQQLEAQQQAKISHSYSESLPVEVVKVDKDCRSIFNFERAFEKFKNQQRLLLMRHNELGR